MKYYRFQQTATICFNVYASNQEEATEKARAFVAYVSTDGADYPTGAEELKIAGHDPDCRAYPNENHEDLELVDYGESL